MSDFLGRMAGRTLGTVPLARPLIPSAFAPDAAAPEPVVAEINAQAEIGTVAPQTTPPRPQRERAFERHEKAERLLPPQAIPPQPAVVVKRESPAAVPHSEEPHEAAPAPLRQAPAPQESQPTSPPKPDETVPLPPTLRSSSAATAAATPRTEQPLHAAATPAQAAPPVIRVTIGRVDVRAEFPPAATPRSAPERRAVPALSLDDYLKQRIEGKR